MKQDTQSKGTKPWILPLAAGIMVVVALIVVIFIPKGADKGTAKPANTVASLNEEGNLVIHADQLSSEQVSFIRISEDSRIELLARAGKDGTVKAALGTCQSCYGSPGAYYTQEGSSLKCNNCGQTFPVSVLDSAGGGCHPIMIHESILTYQGNDLVIDLEGLSLYEELFAKVADH